jgi:hypothetical protein
MRLPLRDRVTGSPSAGGLRAASSLLDFSDCELERNPRGPSKSTRPSFRVRWRRRPRLLLRIEIPVMSLPRAERAPRRFGSPGRGPARSIRRPGRSERGARPAPSPIPLSREACRPAGLASCTCSLLYFPGRKAGGRRAPSTLQGVEAWSSSDVRNASGRFSTKHPVARGATRGSVRAARAKR